ncbi:MAG: BolA/IbaG family iron-sulfur metabolism protein [Oscillatoriales cyanobacterium SM2_2_1]|nr:BolA/IbaG family iron-sulfur metabolism protein [Oscillatoriales cyanobacterium SM2_2_1]
MMTADAIRDLILQALPQAQVDVQDPNQDGQHFAAIVVAPEFEGLTTVKQHRLVNDALKEPLQSGAVHALQLRTFSPSQWQQNQVTFS